MKFRQLFTAATLIVILFSTQAFAGKAVKDRKTFGLQGIGHYTITSYDSAYVSFPTSSIKVAGSGFNTFFEYGFADNFSFEGSVGYERVHYAKQNSNPNIRQVISENFFTLDARGNYYFLQGEKMIQPYATAGVGTTVSSKSAIPLLDLGVGSHFFVADNVSLRVQVLYKTAFIHHHLEAGLGVGFHF